MAWTVSSVRVRAPRIALCVTLACLSLLCLPSRAIAQTVSPQIVEFDPSADHNRTVSGVAVVNGYELRFYNAGGSQPLHVIAIGKPAPASDGKIRFNFTARLGAWPVDGVVYVARVAAVGPGGSTTSTISNQFVFPGTTPPPPPCTYTLSQTSRSVASAAITGSVSVTAGSGCAWTASGAPAAGSQSPAAPVVRQRDHQLQRGRQHGIGSAIGDAHRRHEDFTLTQAGPCAYTLSPTTRTVGTAAATGTVGVTAGSTCTWSASSSASWLTITGGGSGTGNGTVSYSIAANSSSAARSATLSIGSDTFTVTQNGSCVFTVSPTSQRFNPSSNTGSVAVTVASGCSWTATRSGSWITITSGASGTGNGTVRYRVTTNTGSSSRTGTLTVAGQPVIITQSAATAPNSPAGLRITGVR